MQIEWSDKYAVGVESIDEQHKYFFSLINEAFQALEDRDYEAKMDHLLDKIMSYAEYHFETEESLLESCNCAELQHQRNEHYKIAHQLRGLINKRDRVKDVLPYYYEIIDVLKDWLIHHLTSDDQLYVKHLKEHGIQ
jgi:hemerythrin-like metal-binding protein